MSDPNQRAAREPDTETGTAEDYAAYDQLPRPVRRALQVAVIDYAVPELLTLYQLRAAITDPARAVRYLCEVIVDSDRVEVEEFSAAHAARHGCASPHVAAGASILGQAGPPPPLA